MAKANYNYDKRQRDLARQKKREDKRLKKLAKKASEAPSPDSAGVAQDETS